VLANRYGKFEEAEFNSTGRPGTMYLARAGQAACGVQRLWRFFWPITLARRCALFIYFFIFFRVGENIGMRLYLSFPRRTHAFYE
jgi:hypothetical protein